MPLRPRRTIAVLTDAHVRADQDPMNARARLRAALATLRRRGADLLLTLGDMADRPYAEDLRLVKRMVRWRAPWTVLAIPGNHDVGTAEDPQERAPYARLFGPDRPTWGWIVDGVLIVGIDNAAADARWSERLEARQDWLARVLERYRNLPVIAAMHTPLVPMRDADVLARSFRYYSWISQDPEERLRRLLERHGERLVGVLAGHLHLTGMRVDRGLTYFVPSGTYSWPCHYGLVQIYHDKVVMTAEHVDPAPHAWCGMERFPLRNGIHDRHAGEPLPTDRAHPTPERYVSGNAEEWQCERLIRRRSRLFSVHWPRQGAPVPGPETRPECPGLRRGET